MKRKSLLIGNINYNNSCCSNLPFVKSDLELMNETLSTMKYSSIVKEDVSCTDINSLLDSFFDCSDAEENDINIIYYSGHGAVLENHDLCLVTIEDRNNIGFYKVQDIVQKIRGRKGNYLIVLDACRYGEREYAPVFNNADCYILYATDAGKESYARNVSFFTAFLCKNMLNAGISIGALFSMIMRDMKKAGCKQTPVAIQSASRDFVLFPMPFETILDESGKQAVFSIDSMDEQIRSQSKYDGLGIDFFELDDKNAELKIQIAIEDENETVYIVGKSREETLYRVLNFIKNKYFDKPTLIIRSEEQWNRLITSDAEGFILVPYFYSSDAIPAKKGNINIYIFDESDTCPYQNKIVLRRRTQKNIYEALIKIGIDRELAGKYIEETNGYFCALNKRLFRGAIMNLPQWLDNTPNAAYIALLCSMWTNTPADRLFVEKLSGYSYDEFWHALEPFSYGSDPLIIQSYKHGEKIIQIAAYTDVWEELHDRIDDSIWERFDRLFVEQIKIHIECDHNDFNMLAHEALPTECTSTLKEGIIRTLIMRACRNSRNNQRAVDSIIQSVLNYIVDEKGWRNISDLIRELCEASPEAVLRKLENELNKSTGLCCLFPGERMARKSYDTEYLNYLWAMEDLLRQKQYVVRAVEWLWKADDLWKPDAQRQTIIELLERVFCPWSNTCALSTEQKKTLIKQAVETHLRTWDVLVEELPSQFSSYFELAKPRYRQVHEQEAVTYDEYQDCIKEYFAQSIVLCSNNVERWTKLLETIEHLDVAGIKNTFDILLQHIEKENDCWKHIIKEKLRCIISNHRRFTDADWYMGEEKLELYEDTFSHIQIESKEYEYLYLFKAEYDFPLLHPEVDDDEQNDKMREKEIRDRFTEFKQNDLKIELLINLACNQKDETPCLGTVLAEFYCEGEYKKEILDYLILYHAYDRQVYDYVVTFIRMGENIDLECIINAIENVEENIPYICTIISLNVVEHWENALILQQSEEIKDYYWKNKHIDISEKADEDTCIKLLDDCHQYGSFARFIRLLYETHDRIKPEQVLEELDNAISFEDYSCEQMTQYYITEMLDNIRSCSQTGMNALSMHSIALTEWQYRNLLKWENMKSFQQEMRLDPSLYAALVEKIYKKEDKEDNPEKQKIAQQYISIFWKMKFCPGEINGKVDIDILQKWAKGFKDLLSTNKQAHLWGHLLGKLLAYSPAGEDGYVPCEEVRAFIERNATDKMLSSFETEMFNMRGGHFSTAGDNERQLSDKYKKIAEELNTKYPQTAQIYYQLSDTYKMESEMDRKQAEDDL